MRVFSEKPPFRFAALFHEDRAVVADCIAWMKSLVNKLEELEKLANNDSFFKGYLDLMEWPLCQVDREVLLSFQECSCNGLPTDILASLKGGFRGMACSRGVEVAFQKLENETRQHKAGRLSALFRWQRLVSHDNLGRNDRAPLVISAADKYAALNIIPKETLSTKGAECSLPKAMMDQITDPKAF